MNWNPMVRNSLRTFTPVGVAVLVLVLVLALVLGGFLNDQVVNKIGPVAWPLPLAWPWPLSLPLLPSQMSRKEHWIFCFLFFLFLRLLWTFSEEQNRTEQNQNPSIQIVNLWRIKDMYCCVAGYFWVDTSSTLRFIKGNRYRHHIYII